MRNRGPRIPGALRGGLSVTESNHPDNECGMGFQPVKHRQDAGATQVCDRFIAVQCGEPIPVAVSLESSATLNGLSTG